MISNVSGRHQRTTKVHTPKKKVSGLVGFFANDDDVKSSSSSSSSDDDEFRGIGRATKRETKEQAQARVAKEAEARKVQVMRDKALAAPQLMKDSIEAYEDLVNRAVALKRRL